jgi:hypothetical protein
MKTYVQRIKQLEAEVETLRQKPVESRVPMQMQG